MNNAKFSAMTNLELLQIGGGTNTNWGPFPASCDVIPSLRKSKIYLPGPCVPIWLAY